MYNYLIFNILNKIFTQWLNAPFGEKLVEKFVIPTRFTYFYKCKQRRTRTISPRMALLLTFLPRGNRHMINRLAFEALRPPKDRRVSSGL